MPRRKPNKGIRFENFGSVTGLAFERRGAAEILMTFPEVSRVIHAWLDHETSKSKPDEKTLAALKLLCRKVHKLRVRIIAEVPIARRRAKIQPIFTDE